ncbi:MAG: ROK family protein [Actinomycetia bacterium]|nr:ROK family protein [Actinomycetes bacterium]
MPTATNDRVGVIVGLDIGGTKTHAVGFDAAFNQLCEVRVPTKVDDNSDVADLALETISTLEAHGGHQIIGIGIGIPGLVDQQRGSVRQAVNLGIGTDPLDIVARLTSVHDVPCFVENDVNVAGLGAYRMLRSNLQVSDLAYLSIGTGIAASVILNGHLHRGNRGVTGEIGHFPIAADGPLCECGLRGCLEAVASGAAISRQWPGSGGISSSESLIAEAGQGNRDASAVLDPIADHLAKAIYLLAITYDVDYVVVGGGVADIGEPILATIREGLERLESQSELVRSLELQDRVLLKPAGPVSSLGAAALTDLGHRR